MNPAETLRQSILDQVREYYSLTHGAEQSPFVPGISRVNCAGRVFDDAEMVNLVDSALEFWLTHGRYADAFERELASFLGLRYCILVNSGSSANLLAFMALTSPELGDRRICPGDHVITTAAGFPTTISPIVNYGAVPIFLDVDLATANLDTSLLEGALTPRTKAVFIAHTLGNPADLSVIQEFCKEHELWLIEDNCDALGATYGGKLTGTFGDLATSSFYPAHQMTMGEGGAVYTDNPELKQILISLRDWGRDCWCKSGKDNTCGKRFSGNHGDLPFGYDHKYVYSHFGYNLKATEMQASIGLAQIEKLSEFVSQRRINFNVLAKGFADLSDTFHLPQSTPESTPSWFGYLLTLRDDLGFDRRELVQHLEAANIQTRMLFAGNMVRQPCMQPLQEGKDYIIGPKLTVTDKLMKDAFWIGVYPGMREEALTHMITSVVDFVKSRSA